eukprot:TRINITY_DN3800_c0_g1_i2.p1 TRINITY_DN3800_c0_g1~~TRINITY_DN3800_c0_g1_i2.p1  ORF type:complete len:189 (-),score=54.69 TRINITY_DN3800_c0_g1_i2:51-617(-)
MSENEQVKGYLSGSKAWKSFEEKELKVRMKKENTNIGRAMLESMIDAESELVSPEESVDSKSSAKEEIKKGAEDYSKLGVHSVILMPNKLDEEAEEALNIHKWSSSAIYLKSEAWEPSKIVLLPRQPKSPLSLVEPADSFESMMDVKDQAKRMTQSMIVVGSSEGPSTNKQAKSMHSSMVDKSFGKTT